MEGSRPTGTVSFLFTDIEGSTGLWERHVTLMRRVLARHDEILRGSIAAHRGVVFATAGDAFSAAFWTPMEALDAAVDAQRVLQAEAWPGGIELKVRMGIHVGAADERDGDYFGPEVNRAARLMSLAHGRQVLVSLAVQQLTRNEPVDGAALVWLGVHELRGLSQTESVFQLNAPGLPHDFGPLKGATEGKGNLPTPATSFLGRVEELKRLTAELPSRRMITLFGPGGVGKTRLAIEAATDAADHYPDGVWLVELAPLVEHGAVAHAAGAVLGVRVQEGLDPSEAVIEAIRGRRLLLVLDNCEHVLDAVAALAARLIEAAPNVTVLATSREPLGIPGELVWSVPPLEPRGDGVDLFCDRASLADAAFVPTDADREVIGSICAHLDGMPLAIE